MTDNANEITVDNSVLILIDHQPWVAFGVNSIDPSLLSNNLEGLASSAKALEVPVILTTVGAEGGRLKDPLTRAVANVFRTRPRSTERPRTPGPTSAKQSKQQAARHWWWPGCGQRCA
jgi:nicotinamidase-related amidase